MVLAWLKEFISHLNITVEPIMFLLAAANSFRSIVTPSLAEAKMKRYYPAPVNMTSTDLKKFYNEKMVLWDNNYQYVNLPIACIIGIMYGGFSDHYGRKLPLLVGLLSLITETTFRMLMYAPQTDWSLEWIFPSAIIAGMLGDQMLTMSCINAFVTDKFENKKVLSIRMIIVSIMFSLGSFVSSRVVKVWFDHHKTTNTEISIMGTAQGMYCLTFLVGIFFVKNIIPKKKERLQSLADESGITESTESSVLEVPEKKTFGSVIYLSFVSIFEAAKIFAVNREGHRRLFLFLCFAANFLDQFVFGEEKSLIGTYTRLSPFNWTTSTYAEYKSWRPIVQILGMFFGMIVFKKWLKLRDTLIICFAIGSMGACVLMIGLAKASWVIFASLAPGSLHGLLNPLTYSFMSCLVEPDEIGKAYAVSSIAQKLAEMAQTAVLQNIYIATLSWYQGFVWILMSGVSFFAVGIYLVVHFVARREEIGI